MKALVYIAGVAPEPGEPLSAPGAKFATPAIGSAFIRDAAGFLYVDGAKFHDVFCKDLSAGNAQVMAGAQKPVNGAVFGASVSAAAWKTIPSWYIVSSQDRALNPELERFYAKRIGAKAVEIEARHVSFLSHPREVAKVIEEASRESL